MRSNNLSATFNDILPRAGVRLLRLAGLSAVLGLAAGSGVRVYAQDAAAPSAQPAAQVETADAATPAPSEAQPAVASGDTAPLAPANAKNKKKKKKEKAPKLTPLHIEQGTLTVDGWTGKARLNYDIADIKFIYVWAPGIGTVVASNQKFPFGKEEPGAFNGNNLTLEAAGHIIQISSEKKLLKDKKPQSAYVYLDTVYKTSSAFPQMGYGNGKDAPYAWPGAKDAPVNKGSNVALPPLPRGMRPSIAVQGCVSPAAGATAAAVPCPALPVAPRPPATPATPAVPPPAYSAADTTAKVETTPQTPAQ